MRNQAYNALGYIYMRGEGVPRNLTAAEYYFSKAIAEGIPKRIRKFQRETSVVSQVTLIPTTTWPCWSKNVSEI